jgi:hypothetical protein
LRNCKKSHATTENYTIVKKYCTTAKNSTELRKTSRDSHKTKSRDFSNSRETSYKNRTAAKALQAEDLPRTMPKAPEHPPCEEWRVKFPATPAQASELKQVLLQALDREVGAERLWNQTRCQKQLKTFIWDTDSRGLLGSALGGVIKVCNSQLAGEEGGARHAISKVRCDVWADLSRTAD